MVSLVVVVGPILKHASYATATSMDENGDMFGFRSLPKTSTNPIWVAWEVRGSLTICTL